MQERLVYVPRPDDLSLEELIDRIAASGRLPMLNLTKTDRGYQCSLQRHDNKASWGVFVKPTASEAMFAALGPYAFQTWEEHLGPDRRGAYTQAMTEAYSREQQRLAEQDEEDDFSHLI